MQVVKLLAGRQGRVVHALDIVPALPPLDNYAHVDYSRWIPRNSTIVLEVLCPVLPPDQSRVLLTF